MMKRILIFLILAVQAQGAITFVNVGTVTSGTAAITVAQPATPAVNDIWVMVVQSSNQSIAVPTNATAGTWTELTSAGSGPSNTGTGVAATSGSVRIGFFWHRWTTTTGNVTVADTGDHQLAQIAAYRGVKTSGNPYSVINVGLALAQLSNTSGTKVPTALQTSVAGGVILLLVADGTDNATSTMNISTAGSANTGTVNQRIRTNISTAAGGGIGMSDATVTATSTNTSISLSNSAGVNTIYFTIALEELVATPTPTPGPNTGAFLPFFAPGWLKPWFLWKL